MRCKNCGWENPNENSTCEKCHAKLHDTMPVQEPTSHISDRMKSTVSEGVIFNDSPSICIPETCPKCGYPVSENSTSCPNCNHELPSAIISVQSVKCKMCGAELTPNAKFCSSCGTPVNETTHHTHVQRTSMSTVMGGPILGSSTSRNRFCTLKPISWEGEDVDHNPITYSGETIVLNRANTDANNNSITSREQAILTYENGEWYIENRSELRTTFIRVNGRIKLTTGDTIVLGNREFEFKG